MDQLARVLDEMRAREEHDDTWADGYDHGYAKAKAELEELLDAKGPAAAKIKAIRAWKDAP